MQIAIVKQIKLNVGGYWQVSRKLEKSRNKGTRRRNRGTRTRNEFGKCELTMPAEGWRLFSWTNIEVLYLFFVGRP